MGAALGGCAQACFQFQCSVGTGTEKESADAVCRHTEREEGGQVEVANAVNIFCGGDIL